MAYSKHKKESKSSLTQQGMDVYVADTSVVDNAITTDNEGDREDLLSDRMTVESNLEFDNIESVEDMSKGDDDNEGVDFGDKISLRNCKTNIKLDETRYTSE